MELGPVVEFTEGVGGVGSFPAPPFPKQPIVCSENHLRGSGEPCQENKWGQDKDEEE